MKGVHAPSHQVPLDAGVVKENKLFFFSFFLSDAGHAFSLFILLVVKLQSVFFVINDDSEPISRGSNLNFLSGKCFALAFRCFIRLPSTYWCMFV